MKSILCGSIAILLIPTAYAALPGDATEGRGLHDANCLSCHDTGIYDRKNRTVRSLDALKRQVEGCGHMANKQFSATETQNIVKYLNDRFYHFQ